MKIKKIVMAIAAVGTIAGTAYAFYKYNAEKKKDNLADDSEEEITFYDEDDDFSLSDNSDNAEKYCLHEKCKLPHVRKLDTDDFEIYQLKMILYRGIENNFLSNKIIRDTANVNFETAKKLLDEFQKAGYIGNKKGNYTYPVCYKISDIYCLTSDYDSEQQD